MRITGESHANHRSIGVPCAFKMELFNTNNSTPKLKKSKKKPKDEKAKKNSKRKENESSSSSSDEEEDEYTPKTTKSRSTATQTPLPSFGTMTNLELESKALDTAEGKNKKLKSGKWQESEEALILLGMFHQMPRDEIITKWPHSTYPRTAGPLKQKVFNVFTQISAYCNANTDKDPESNGIIKFLFLFSSIH